MIAFASLVVVPKYTFSPLNVGQPILVRVGRSGKWLRDLPSNKVGKRVITKRHPLTDQQGCLHVGNSTNKAASSQQTVQLGAFVTPNV